MVRGGRMTRHTPSRGVAAADGKAKGEREGGCGLGFSCWIQWLYLFAWILNSESFNPYYLLEDI
jgi:hypothetical protein